MKPKCADDALELAHIKSIAEGKPLAIGDCLECQMIGCLGVPTVVADPSLPSGQKVVNQTAKGKRYVCQYFIDSLNAALEGDLLRALDQT